MCVAEHVLQTPDESELSTFSDKYVFQHQGSPINGLGILIITDYYGSLSKCKPGEVRVEWHEVQPKVVEHIT